MKTTITLSAAEGPASKCLGDARRSVQHHFPLASVVTDKERRPKGPKLLEVEIDSQEIDLTEIRHVIVANTPLFFNQIDVHFKEDADNKHDTP